jgi:solute carrier family 50 protein (sugar transporter)
VCIFGEIATIVLITIYVRYCDDRVYVAKTLAYGLVPIILVTIYFILVESGAVHQSNHSFGLVLGYLSDATTFILFASPFEKIKHVILTKSSAAIPVLMCVVICINSLLWLINGIADNDLFILVPNSVGVVITLIQIALYFVYRPGRLVPVNGMVNDKIDVVVDVDVAMDAKTPMCSPKSPVFQLLSSPLAPIKQ